MNHFGQIAIPVAVIALVLYRRIRRTIGFQLFSARRLRFRLVLFAVIGVLLLATGIAHPIRYLADAGGIAIGTILAYFAIRHSEFERRGKELYFRTHIGIQTAVVALFIGRIAYRLLFFAPAGQTAAANQDPMQQFTKDPWTAAVFFILVAYYIGYYSFLLRQEKHHRDVGP